MFSPRTALQSCVIRVFLVDLFLLLLVTAGGWIYQAQAEGAALRSYPPPGQMVELDGYAIRLECTGQGSPTVVLDSGWPDTGLVWAKVQPQVAEKTRTCSYDRAGLGWSSPNPAAPTRTAEQAVEELHALLAAASEPGPYLLVGHSLGGAHARVFAHRYPAETAGLVLVDAATLEDFATQQPEYADMNASYLTALNWAARLAPIAIHRLFLPRGFTHSALPAELVPASQAITLRAQNLRTAYAERQGIWTSLEQAGPAEPGQLGDLPLVVLTSANTVSTEDVPAGFPLEAANQAHREAQALLPALSSQGRQVIDEHSDHYIHLRNPELVVEAILALIP